jgi:hypothetical protein
MKVVVLLMICAGVAHALQPQNNPPSRPPQPSPVSPRPMLKKTDLIEPRQITALSLEDAVLSESGTLWFATRHKLDRDQATLSEARWSQEQTSHLYRFDGARFHLILSDSQLAGSQLIPGARDSMIICGVRGRCWIIEGDEIHSETDLHELAQKQHELFLRVAPSRYLPASFPDTRAFDRRPTFGGCFRTGELLWVFWGMYTDVYRHGQSLHLKRRLDLLQAPEAWRYLSGPFAQNPPEILITCGARQRFDTRTYLVRVDEGRIRLSPLAPSSDDDIPTFLLPILSDDQEKMYLTDQQRLYKRRSQFISPLPRAVTAPILVAESGELLAHTQDGHIARVRGAQIQGYLPLASYAINDLAQTESGFVALTTNGFALYDSAYNLLSEKAYDVASPKYYNLAIDLQRFLLRVDDLLVAVSGTKKRQLVFIKD